MRLIILLIAAAALSAETTPTAEVSEFQRALDAGRSNDASGALDKLIAERAPTDGKPRQDPLLNALFGRLYLAADEPDPAAIFLDNTPLTLLPATLRASTALDHGRALELRGERAAALAAYRDASNASAVEADRRRAIFGIARQLLADQPSAARDQVAAIASGAATADRWEARYITAIADSLLGDQAKAEQSAQLAWADAVYAPARDLAPLHVATLRAALAAARKDPAGELAMLSVTHGLRLFASAALSAQLPVCGERGIKQSDYVIFGFVAGPYGTNNIFPVAASRPEVVASFTDALAGTSPIKDAKSNGPSGTAFTVACRNTAEERLVAKPAPNDPLVEWFVRNGLYPASASSESEDEHLNAVADRIDSLAARFGTNSLMLVYPRWQMMTMLESRARQGDPVTPGQLKSLGTQIGLGLRRAGAPEWMARLMETRADYVQAAAAFRENPQELPAILALVRDQLLRTPPRLVRQFVNEMLSQFKDDWPAPVSHLVVDLNAHVAPGLSGFERQAWLLTVSHAEHQLGDEVKAREMVKSAGVSGDSCFLGDSGGKLLEQHFSYKDYPLDLISAEQEGAVLFEFGLSQAGTPTGHRIIYSLPSNLFDAPSAKGLATIRFTPQQRSGRSVACSGFTQPILWRIEENDNFSIPTLTPDTSGPTT